MKSILKKIEDNKLLIYIDLNVFEKEAVLKCSYKYTNVCYIDIEEKNHYLEVYLMPKKTNEEIESIALNFKNDLIDQQVRLTTEREYKEIRETLIKKAFSSLNKP